MLRAMKGLMREEGRRQRGRTPLVVFGVEDAEGVLGTQAGQTVLLGVEEGDGQREHQTVLFEVVEGETRERKSGEGGEHEDGQPEGESKGKTETQGNKSVEKKNGATDERDMEDGDEMTEGKAEIPDADEMSPADSPAIEDSAEMKAGDAVGKDNQKTDMESLEIKRIRRRTKGDNLNKESSSASLPAPK